MHKVIMTYFCPDCEEIKEERYFRKCDRCGEIQKHSDMAGAYNCSFHDEDNFSIKNGQIICNKCKIDNKPMIKLEDTKDQQFEKYLVDKLEYLKYTLHFCEDNVLKYKKSLAELDLQKEINIFMNKIKNTFDIEEQESLYLYLHIDDHSTREYNLSELRQAEKRVNEIKLQTKAYEKALMLFKMEKETK